METQEGEISRWKEGSPMEGNGGARAKGKSSRIIASCILGLALIGGAIVSARWLYYRLTHVITDAAYVKADMASVAPEVGGRIVDVMVREGERVAPGQLLVRVEDDDWRHREEQALAKVQEMELQLVRRQAVLERTRVAVKASIDAAEAAFSASRQQLTRAKANLEYLEAQERRMAALVEREVISRAQWDQIHSGAAAARAEVAAAKEQVALAEARLREALAATHTIHEAEAAVRETEAGLEQARAALNQIRWTRGRTEVTSPIQGVVARVFVRTGDFAVPGRPLVALYDPQSRYVEARFEENKVAQLQLGQEAEVTVDALPGLVLRGRIRRIAPAAAQEFALIPRDVTAGEFTKVVQRVPVELEILELQRHPEVVPGLSVVVAVKKNHGGVRGS